jgi:hypothetical protein
MVFVFCTKLQSICPTYVCTTYKPHGKRRRLIIFPVFYKVSSYSEDLQLVLVLSHKGFPHKQNMCLVFNLNSHFYANNHETPM